MQNSLSRMGTAQDKPSRTDMKVWVGHLAAFQLNKLQSIASNNGFWKLFIKVHTTPYELKT